MNKMYYVITRKASDGRDLYLQHQDSNSAGWSFDINDAAIWKSYGSCIRFLVKHYNTDRYQVNTLTVKDHNKDRHKIGEDIKV